LYGIRLFFTNFPLVSVSQHNANSIAIFRQHLFLQYNYPAFLSIFLRRRPSVISHSTNQLPRWPYKNHDTHSLILF